MISSDRSSNATVRDDIRRDYCELRALLAAASDCLSVPLTDSSYTPRQIVATLRRLQHRLAVHFTLEEAFGYGEEELSRAPWLAHSAKTLRSEHDAIFDRLKLIVRCSEALLEEESTCSLLELSALFQDFVIDFRIHENCDAELLLSIFDDDLGVGD